MAEENFFNIDTLENGIERALAPGLRATIFPGDQAMLSVVVLEPGAKGEMHHHPEEQWGYCLEGAGLRYQGDKIIPIKAGDFWRTPGGVPHTMEASEEGLKVLDIFAPPREAYRKPGEGFAAY
ncbi:MAG: cupin domain-containing protein [Pseudomonadota bacterium]